MARLPTAISFPDEMATIWDVEAAYSAWLWAAASVLQPNEAFDPSGFHLMGAEAAWAGLQESLGMQAARVEAIL